MTGWRIGWAAGRSELIAALLKVKQFTDTDPLLAIQQAAAATLDQAEAILPGVRDVFRRGLLAAHSFKVGRKLPLHPDDLTVLTFGFGKRAGFDPEPLTAHGGGSIDRAVFGVLTIVWGSGWALWCEAEAGQRHDRKPNAELLDRLPARNRPGQAFGEFIEFAVPPLFLVLLFVTVFAY